MGQREQIISLLKSNGSMSQGDLAEAIFGNRNHAPNIYTALMKLVNSGIVKQTGKYPSYYSLIVENAINPNTDIKVNADNNVFNASEITNLALENAENSVRATNNYGPENELISRCLNRFPLNNDADIVAMKIGLIDITNSTHLAQYKSKISVVELANIISTIPNIDQLIQEGNPEAVNLIAKSNGRINLFSFASKYCCYHNRNLYNRDDYSILDSILKECLPKYFKDITKGKIQKWQDTYNYKQYNDYITNKLNELNITVAFRKRKFDHFVWFNNR